ncbi:MAG: malonate transporter subunit MadL [Planctomycetota bacterium]|nr:malonate transporter subunit MadL [Planctomycetota bacterium]
MTIYGTALLSICLLAGVSIGKVLGKLAGVDADIGGVGIAMLLLIFSTDWLRRTGRLKPPTELGVSFWGLIYIPIVVAMAASQNVLAALKAGAVAVVAGIAVVVVSFGLVGVLARYGQPAVTAEQESE